MASSLLSDFQRALVDLDDQSVLDRFYYARAAIMLEDNREADLMASLVATMMSTYFNRDDEIETYLETYNDSFPQLAELNARFEAVIAFLKELSLPEKSRAWRKVDFYNLAVEIDRQLFANEERPEPRAAAQALRSFYDSVERARYELPSDEDVKRYFEATLQNTNDRYQRIARGEVIRKILESVSATPFKVEVPEDEPPLTDLIEVEEEADAAEEAISGGTLFSSEVGSEPDPL